MVNNKFLSVVLYNNDEKLIDIICVPMPVSFDDINFVFKNDSSAVYAKVFLWDSKEALKPLTCTEMLDIF